jgi:FkbM family methyltransferase
VRNPYAVTSRALLGRLKHLLLPIRMRFALRGSPIPVLVEVGANDGKTGDPLYRLIRDNPACKALLIEPIPYLYERLRVTYSGLSHCVLANVAIAPTAGAASIYYIDSRAKECLSDLPVYFEELASFHKHRIANVLGDRGASFLRQQLVQTVPLKALLAEHRITNVDLLQIDTEGFDFEVLKTFPFDTIVPELVCFEQCHLCEADRASAVSLMISYGYRIEKWGKDFVCAQRRFLGGRKAWSAITPLA